MGCVSVAVEEALEKDDCEKQKKLSDKFSKLQITPAGMNAGRGEIKITRLVGQPFSSFAERAESQTPADRSGQTRDSVSE